MTAAAHAEILAADAVAVEGCADRLRALAQRLRGHDAVPPWLYEQLHEHITACTVAAAELTVAADRLRALADHR